MPATHFAELSASNDSLLSFFDQYFPGVTPDLITTAALQEQYEQNPHLPLISIKCTPYHHGSSAVVLGDAAHAMVPFYGQGMNAGLEDVRVLFDLLDQHDVSQSDEASARRAAALAAYTEYRQPDAHAINDLALNNYAEMRSAVRSPLYRTRKWIEERLDVWFPRAGWSTKYSRVSFGNQRYSEVVRATDAQSQMLLGMLSVLGLGVVGGLGAVLLRRRR